MLMSVTNHPFRRTRRWLCVGGVGAILLLVCFADFHPSAGEGLMTSQDIKKAMATGAKQLKLRVGTVDFVLLRIQAGSFEIGSPPTEKDHEPSESPVRRICISKPFYLGRTEITQLQYWTVIGDNPSNFIGGSLPVDGITHTRALQFCQELSRLTGVTITLPTEAQWEYACRAGTETPYCSGSTEKDLDEVGWYRENAGGSYHPVAQKKPNAWGLYDMHGNVLEPCIDTLPPYDEIKPIDPVGMRRANHGSLRGGAWMMPAECSRAAARAASNDMLAGTGI